MSARCLATFAFTAYAACTAPLPPEGLPCGPNSECPSGQVCNLDGRCSSTPSDGVDGGGCVGDTCFGNGGNGGDPIADQSGLVGFVIHSGSRALGTVVSPRLVLTCSSCLGDATAGDLSFRMGANTAGVSAVHAAPAGEDVVLLELDELVAAPELAIASAAPNPGESQRAIVARSDNESDIGRYIVEIDIVESDSATFAYTSSQMETPFSCAVGGPVMTQSGALSGVHIEPGCSGAASAYLAQSVVGLASWIEEQIDATSPSSCAEDFVPGSCGVDCGVKTCDDSSGVVVIGCEAGTCTSGTCNPDSNFTCEGDVCTPNEWYSCGGCGQRQCNSSGTGYGNCTSLGDSACGDDQICEYEAEGGIVLFQCVPCPSTCGGCGCYKEDGICSQMQSWCDAGETCEPEVVGAFVIYNCL